MITARFVCIQSGIVSHSLQIVKRGLGPGCSGHRIITGPSGRLDGEGAWVLLTGFVWTTKPTRRPASMKCRAREESSIAVRTPERMRPPKKPQKVIDLPAAFPQDIPPSQGAELALCAVTINTRVMKSSKILCSLVLILMVGCDSPVPVGRGKSKPSRPITVVTLGDSNTAGNRRTPEIRSWPTRLREMEPTWTVINEARGGPKRTTEHGESAGYWISTIRMS